MTVSPRHLKDVERWTLITSALLIAASFIALPGRMAFSATVGAGLMVLNAFAIRKLGERVFRRVEKGQPGVAVLLFNLKMLALIALVYVAVKVLGLDAIGFLLGVSVFPVAIVVAALRMTPDADGDETPPPGDLPLSPNSGDR